MPQVTDGAESQPTRPATRPTIEFYFDFTCPYAYLASTRIEAIARAGGAALRWRPMLLGGVFRSIGTGDSPMERAGPSKARHTQLDMHRFADYMGVPLHKPASHPMRSVAVLRALLALDETRWPTVIAEVYRGYWQRGDNISAESVIERLFERAGIDAVNRTRALAGIGDSKMKAELRRRTDRAVARGVFGAPTVFVWVQDRDQPYMFWGQDRLHMVRAVLAGWRPERAAPTDAQQRAGLSGSVEATARGVTDAHRIDFFYDFSSPFSYLAATQIERIAASAGAELHWRPMLLGALFRELGTPDVPLYAMSEQKQAHLYRDLRDSASYWNVPFRYASHFPQRTVTALRLALLAGEGIAELSHALYRVPWVEDGDLDDRTTLERVLSTCGFDSEAMLARTREPAVKQMLFDNTAEAATRGVFGAPTCIVTAGPNRCDRSSESLYWGQDRLFLVARR